MRIVYETLFCFTLNWESIKYYTHQKFEKDGVGREVIGN